MFRSRLTSRSTGWRIGIAAIAGVCLIGQVTALAHRALVRHATCAEHGESVHVGSQVGSVDTRGGLPGRGVGQSAAGIAGASVVVAEGHDHCSVLVSRSVTSRSPHDQATGPAPILLVRHVLREAVLAAATRPYLIAPKTSPPRLAS